MKAMLLILLTASMIVTLAPAADARPPPCTITNNEYYTGVSCNVEDPVLACVIRAHPGTFVICSP